MTEMDPNTAPQEYYAQRNYLWGSVKTGSTGGGKTSAIYPDMFREAREVLIVEDFDPKHTDDHSVSGRG